MVKLYCTPLILFVITVSNFKEISSIDFELVYSLREYFQSDVILLAKKEDNDEIAKKLCKYKKNTPKAYLGVINIDKISKYFIFPSHIARFENVMIISEYGKELLQKLIEFRKDFYKIIPSLVFIIFTIDDNLKDEMTELYLPFNSRFLLVEEKKNTPSTLEITDVYQIGMNGSKIFLHFGTWDKKGKLNSTRQNFYFRRMDLKGHIINTQLPLDPIYGSLWVMLSENMNFTINHVPVVYGLIYPNGTKTGIFKMIEDRIIDGTQTDYKYSHIRADNFDYVFPVYIAETRTYLSVEESVNWGLFIAPFEITVWIALLIWIILCSITVYFTLNQFKPICIHYDFDHSIFIVLQGLFYQGNRIRSPNISFHIAHYMPYLLSIIIVYSYSGVFLSHLTIKKISPPFHNLQEVIEDGSYKILVEHDSFQKYYFQMEQTEEAILAREKKLLVPENEFLEFEDKKEGFQRLCRQRLIYVTGTSDYSVEEKCNIVSLPEIVFLDVEGIIVWRGFPYRDVMTKLLKRIQAAGLMKLKRKNTIVPYETTIIFKSLSLESVLPIFLLHLCLTIWSIIMFAFEIASEM